MKKIFATARELGIDNDLLHGLVQSQFNHGHISKLTQSQAGRLIDDLDRRKGAQERTIKLPTGRELPLVTRAQLYKIHTLERELGWEENPKRLQGFCKKYAGVDNPDWMTKQQAWRLIEGLKALFSRTPGGDEDGRTATGSSTVDE